MTTTDANGILYSEDSDAIAPFHTYLNLFQAATSTAIGSTARVFPVPNGDARNAKVAAYAPTRDKPLYVFRNNAPTGQELETTTDGTTWRYVPSTRGLLSYTPALTGGATLGTGGSATMSYTVIGNICSWALEISLGTGAGGGAGAYTWGLPAAAPSQNMLGSGYYFNGAFQTFLCQRQAVDTMIMRAGNGTINTWGSGYAPFSAGNVAAFSGQYLVA